jgi:hypothetical protein
LSVGERRNSQRQQRPAKTTTTTKTMIPLVEIASSLGNKVVHPVQARV